MNLNCKTLIGKRKVIHIAWGGGNDQHRVSYRTPPPPYFFTKVLGMTSKELRSSGFSYYLEGYQCAWVILISNSWMGRKNMSFKLYPENDFRTSHHPLRKVWNSKSTGDVLIVALLHVHHISMKEILQKVLEIWNL